MTAFCKALAGSLALATAAGAFGQVYKWTDAEGRVHYGAQPPPAAKATSLANQRSHSANPESNVEVEVSAVQYYAVRGWTPLDLHMSMMQNGPFNEIVQRRVYAEINLQYKWKFDYAEESGRCRINKFVVTLASTITMPRWLLARRLRSLPAYLPGAQPRHLERGRARLSGIRSGEPRLRPHRGAEGQPVHEVGARARFWHAAPSFTRREPWLTH